MRNVVVLALALTATACVTEKSFPKQLAAAQCKALDSCSKAEFSASYDKVSDCVDDLSEAFEDTFAQVPRACEFDPKYAKRAIAAFNAYAKDCNAADGADAYADLNRSYDCGGGGFDTAQ